MRALTSAVVKYPLMRACNSILFRHWLVVLTCFLVLVATDVHAQVASAAMDPEADAGFAPQDVRVLASPMLSHHRSSVREKSTKGRWTSKRQALLIGGMTASVAAYGYFVLAFNNNRSDARNAEKAYEEDVRQNAQRYVDEGIALDEIQTYRDWQESFDHAASSREWGARAGFLAFLIGFFAILDAATSDDGPSTGVSRIDVGPTIGLTASTSDVVVGARLRF